MLDEILEMKKRNDEMSTLNSRYYNELKHDK